MSAVLLMGILNVEGWNTALQWTVNVHFFPENPLPSGDYYIVPGILWTGLRNTFILLHNYIFGKIQIVVFKKIIRPLKTSFSRKDLFKGELLNYLAP